MPPGDAAELLKTGDERADAGQLVEAAAWWRWGYVKRLPQIRGLAFKHPVQARFMTRKALQDRMAYEVDKEWPVEVMQANQDAGAALGFWADDLKLGQLLGNLYTQEVAGFYDPDTKELFLIADPPPEGEHAALKQLWDRLTDKQGEQKMILAHELDHALADQHFDLYSLQASLKSDEDATMALSGLVEGEATVMMMLAIMSPREQAEFLSSPPEVLAAVMDFVAPLAARFAGGKALREAPQFYRETLLIPYTRGMHFVLTLLQSGGWAALDRAYADPPLSSEQLLHPEKYIGQTDPPIAISLDAPPPALAGWRLVKQNTLGELSIRILLQEQLSLSDATAAATGWGGDTYQVYRKGSERRLLWVSRWDLESDAREAANALLARYSAGADSEPPAVVQRGKTVVVLTHAGADKEALLDWAFSASWEQKKLPIRPVVAKAAFPAEADPEMAVLAPAKGIEIPLEPPGTRRILEAMGVLNGEAVVRAKANASAVCACTLSDGVGCLHEAIAANTQWWAANREAVSHPLDIKAILREARRLNDCVQAFHEARIRAGLNPAAAP
ncbi:MAG: hypothetical protein ACI9WU_000759 [Myxococcota bacterium]|jgi:hypothetical protein